MNEFEELKEKTISSETVWSGKVFDCVVKKVELCDGRQSRREIVVHHGGACILPVDQDMNAYLVRQFRSPFETILLEAPAGKLEKDEEPIACATRELREETGFVAGRIDDLGMMLCSPGYCGEKIGMFLATDLKYEGIKLDDGEFLNVVKIPYGELLKKVLDNEITDAKTQIVVLKAAGRLGYGL